MDSCPKAERSEGRVPEAPRRATNEAKPNELVRENGWTRARRPSEAKAERLSPPCAPTEKAPDAGAFLCWCGRGDSNPHGIATASPSSWCVCQFRHFRISTTTGIFWQVPVAAGIRLRLSFCLLPFCLLP